METPLGKHLTWAFSSRIATVEQPSQLHSRLHADLADVLQQMPLLMLHPFIHQRDGTSGACCQPDLPQKATDSI